MRVKTAKAGRIAILAVDGMSMFEFSAACAVFGRIETEVDTDSWYDLAVCGTARRVRLDTGLMLDVPQRLTGLRGAHTVIVPPCLDPWTVDDRTVAAVRAAHARGVRVASLCNGAFVLARAGLLDGRRAATHWAECAELAEAFPAVTVDPDVLYIDDGDILTSAGSAASIDLCLHLVRTDLGVDVATRVARQLVVQPHRTGGQAQYIDAPMPTVATAEPLSETLAWMSNHLHEEISIAGLARRTATSPRSFARHFVAATGSTPYQWLLHQRLRQAARLLEHTDLPVESIARTVRLGDPANLRRHFRRQFGTSPGAYRQAFRVGS